MKMMIIFSVLLITSCTTNLNRESNMCIDNYTYVCEKMGSHTSCWCENTRQLEKLLKFLHNNA
jgi:hypothetical protein